MHNWKVGAHDPIIAFPIQVAPGEEWDRANECGDEPRSYSSTMYIRASSINGWYVTEKGVNVMIGGTEHLIEMPGSEFLQKLANAGVIDGSR